MINNHLILKKRLITNDRKYKKNFNFFRQILPFISAHSQYL
jgi:hypothetical protein